MRKLIFTALGLALICSCMLCGFTARPAVKQVSLPLEAQSKSEAPSSDSAADKNTADSATPSPSENGKVIFTEKISLPQGGKKLLELPDELEAQVYAWRSGDQKTVEADSAGRIDGASEGSAEVEVVFTDGSKGVYEVTVTEPAQEPAADIFSTAITANSDILKKNLNSGYTDPYQIYVNCAENCVTVYTYDENGEYTVPVRAMLCSCGKDGNTIRGKYYTYFKTEWQPLYNNVYGKYATGIDGDFLFHSVPYTELSSSTLETDEFNKLGSNASLGCVRLCVADAKWIYDNCRVGTAVKLYDSRTDGPLGKPDMIKISNLKNGWDPTDNDPNNPYNKLTPKIYGAADKTIKAGGGFSYLEGVTAKDTCSNDITKKITVFGRVDSNRAGKYKLTYSVEDALHRTDSVTVTVTVSGE